MIMREQLGPPDHAKALTWYDMGWHARWLGRCQWAEVILMGRIPALGAADAAARPQRPFCCPMQRPQKPRRRCWMA